MASEVQSDYDTAGRLTARIAPPEFFAWLIPHFARNLRFNLWLNTHADAPAGQADANADTVAELWHLEQSHAPWLFLLEFQLEPDPNMLSRGLEYLGRLLRVLRPGDGRGDRYQPCFGVVNLTGSATGRIPAGGDFRLPMPGRPGLNIQPIEVHLSDEKADLLLHRIERGRQGRSLLPYIPLMRTSEPLVTIRKWLSVASQELDVNRRTQYGILARVLAEKSVFREMWQESLEDWAVIRSPFLEKFRDEGRAEGFNKGRLAERAASVIRVLELRCKQKAPVDLVASVSACENLERLQEWLEIAATVQSIEQFRQLTAL